METRITNRILISVLMFVALILNAATNSKAAAGDLDVTFGGGGIVITRGSHLNYLNAAQAMAIQSDGKIVVVGDGATSGTWDFAVVRYNTDGSLDTSFGGTGIVHTPVGNSHDQANSVAIQADGKIVVAGSICNGVGNCSGAGISLAVVRYNPNGSLDTSFNGTGKVITSVGGSSDWANSVAMQADAKIVVVGSSLNGSNYDLFVVRYNSNGSLDTTFNGTGKIITPNGSDGGYPPSVAIQADSKVVVTGNNFNGTGYDTTIFRYNTDGSPDTSFNGTGSVITSGGGARALAIQPDGKIVVAGNSYDSGVGSRFAFVRFNSNGSLDTSFGGTGIIVIPVGGNGGGSASSAAIQADGKIVAAGTRGTSYAVVRLSPNGSLDTTFNDTGIVITPFCCQSYAIAVAIQADGKIVVAGGTDDMLYDFYDYVVVRYLGRSNENIRNRFDFDGDGRADLSVFRPTDSVWYLDRSAQGFYAAQFGLSTDKLTPADYDGDGKTDIAIFRDGTWWRINSGDSTIAAVKFGIPGDIPVPADYTGDGRDELAVYRNGQWWSHDFSSGSSALINFGLAADKPVPADYDGDGRVDQAVYRNAEWHLNRSTLGYTVVRFGLATDRPVVGDYDGDGKADQAVYRNGVWYILGTSQGFTAFQWGVSSDVPAPADYDGDGKTDPAVYRGGRWYLLQSTGGVSIQQFGLVNDKPVPAAYLP